MSLQHAITKSNELTVKVNMTTLKSFGDASLFLIALIASFGLEWQVIFQEMKIRNWHIRQPKH